MKSPLRIHLLPVGQDEVERIIRPAELGKADRIYLITMKGEDLFKSIYDKTKKELISRNVVQAEQLKEIKCNLYDFTEMMQIFSTIIKNEKEEGNFIYFNISTGGKLISTAGILSCFLFGAKPYYCKKDYKNNQIPTNPEIMYFPNYHIDIPDKELVHFLVEMKRFSEETSIKNLTKSECIAVLNKIQPELHLSQTEPKDHNKLNRGFLDKLERLNFVIIERKPRGKVSLTEEGEFAIAIFSGFFGFEVKI